MNRYRAFALVAAAAAVGLAACADPTAAPTPRAISPVRALVAADAPVTGSIKTTLPSCIVVNANVQYTAKTQVYLNGGGGQLGPLAPVGDYFVRVTSPMGTVLGSSVDEGGNFVGVHYAVASAPNPCIQVWGLVKRASSGYADDGYDDTDNSGREYQLEVCADAAFTPARCKYDNFKVRQSDDPPPDEFGLLSVDKFFDANGNGARDAGEPLIAGWEVTLNELLPGAFATQTTPASWNNLPEALYSVTESVRTGWFISYKGSTSGLEADNLLDVPVALVGSADAVRTIPGIDLGFATPESRMFGNYCLTGSGGHTLGFWSNGNGQAILLQNDDAWRTLINGPNMVTATPTKTSFVVSSFKLALLPSSFATFNAKKQLTGGEYFRFREWILAAQASANGEARYMLSAQLAAMLLNTSYGDAGGPFVGGGAFDPVSGMTIDALMNAAKLALADQTTSRDRVLQLKTWLDRLNNGGGVIPTNACGATLVGGV